MNDKPEEKTDSEMLHEIETNGLLAIIAKGTDLIRDKIRMKGFFSSRNIRVDQIDWMMEMDFTFTAPNAE
jgi:hypothetical protein